MAVPKFQDFLYPFLYQLRDKDVTLDEMYNALVKHFGLSEDDCRLTTKGGVNQVKDRIGWVRQWLRRSLFLTIPQRGTYRITERGREYLANHKSLSKDDLLHYKEYAEYCGKAVINDNDVQNPSEHKYEAEQLTPTEQLEQAYAEINNDLAQEILSRLFEMSPSKFEQVVLDVMLAMGYGNPNDNSAKVTQYSHDEGIDGIIPQDKLGFDKIYFQAKRYNSNNTVGTPLIHAFFGALEVMKANKGVFITTSKFTNSAYAAVDKASKKIILIDGQQLAHYMIEYNVGVSKLKVYQVKRIDSDYFNEE